MPFEFHPNMQELLDMVNEHFPELDPEDAPVLTVNPLSGIKNVVIYVRLSKLDRRKKQVSPNYQLRNTRALSRSMRWNVLKVFDKDIGVSGKDFDRPDWDRMIEFVKGSKVKVDAVVVDAVSRFARSTKEGLITLDELAELGVWLRVADDPYCAPETARGRMTLTQELERAEWERLITVERTKKALRELRLEGHQVGRFPKHFTEDSEKKIVPTPVARQVVFMRSRGASYNQIAKALGIAKGDVWNIAKFVAKARLQQVSQVEAEEEMIVA